MKKTISTSIGGIVFNVEEDAHDKLAAYLDAISASLKDSEGHNEIMSDIESRIAEILQQKISAFKQVITIAEIDEVIGIMGKPEDFGAPQGAGTQQTYSTYTSGPGGRRRIYRDMDDKVIFGVCSGLSHHFGIDPIWLRFALGAAFLFGGFGLVLYLLLAVIMPKARTTAEKLEMMGEPVDINNIRKTIEDDMEHIKSKVKDFSNDIRSGRGNDRAKEFGKNLEDFFNSLGHGVGNLLGGVIKAILTFVALTIAVAFAIVLVGLIASLTSGVNIINIGAGHHMLHYSARSFFDMLSVTGAMRTILLTGIFLFLGVPIMAVIVRFGRAAAGRKQPFQWFTITAGILWSLSWILMIIGIAAVFSHFSVKSTIKNDNKLTTSGRMLYVTMSKSREYDDAISLDSLNIYISDDGQFEGSPSICITQSLDSTYHLLANVEARGITTEDALNFARGIQYNFSNHDSTLALDPTFSLEPTKGWRKQKLDLIIEVPLNKSVALPEGIDHILCPALHHKGQYIGGEKWTMTATGLMPFSK